MTPDTLSPEYRDSLLAGGLTSHQAKMYEILIKRGKRSASSAALGAHVPRTLAYKALKELESLGLVSKEDAPGMVAQFSAVHPFKLKEVMDNKYKQAKDARTAIDNILGKIISDFNTTSGAPGIRILEGKHGIAELYEDILNERQTIKLIRSPEDDAHPELATMVQKQIEEEKRLGIHTFAITPIEEGAPLAIIVHDSERLTTRRMVPRDKMMIPAQIVIYANKVAITAYKGAIITTIIENPAIKTTFEMTFDYLWSLAEDDHNRIYATLSHTER